MSKLNLNSIDQFKVKDIYGVEQNFRYQLVKLPKTINYNEIPLKYMIVFIGVNQINQATKNALKIVITSMFLFWLLSLIISIFLSHLFMRPILRQWQKQQEFVENASHELKTPLAVVQNKLELLFTKPEETIITNSTQISDALAEIRRMRQLITDLLTLARSDIQKIVVKPADVDLVNEITNLVENYQLLDETKNQEISLEIEDNFPRKIFVDYQLIQQLLVILLDNALKYTPNPAKISVNLSNTHKELIITVKDNGIGIPDQQKNTIFERFTRIDSSRNRETGGFGLGLSIASQIITALHGKITVTDNSPRGSVFKLKIPKS
jgi:two-component system sensor histidine kinase CiaH